MNKKLTDTHHPETANSSDPPEKERVSTLESEDPEENRRRPSAKVEAPVKFPGQVCPGQVYFENCAVVAPVDGIRETEFDVEPEEILAHLTPREQMTFELRLVALRYVAGIEPRSMRAIASDLGVTRAAVSAVYRDVLSRIGSLRIFDNGVKRWKIAEAARLYHATGLTAKERLQLSRPSSSRGESIKGREAA